jgi:hypothetical protein
VASVRRFKRVLYYFKFKAIKNDEVAKEMLLENLLDECVGLKTLTLLYYGELHLNYAKTCLKLAEFYLEYKNYPRQAKMHCENGLDVMKNVVSVESNEVYMKLYYLMGRASTISKKYFGVFTVKDFSIFFFIGIKMVFCIWKKLRNISKILKRCPIVQMLLNGKRKLMLLWQSNIIIIILKSNFYFIF